MKVTSTRFERATTGPAGEPKAPGPDVVFAGRSNVGKSSLINRLLGAKGLARTSSSPGRTQTVNFYRVNERLNFVDLPGYGWAKVPEAVRQAWKPMIEGYLNRRRRRIALALIVVDSRHDPTELDRTMHDWLRNEDIPYLIAATKTDKLNASARSRAERTMLDVFGSAGLAGRPVFVSARNGVGIRELWRHLDAGLESWWDTVGAQTQAPRPVPR